MTLDLKATEVTVEESKTTGSAKASEKPADKTADSDKTKAVDKAADEAKSAEGAKSASSAKQDSGQPHSDKPLSGQPEKSIFPDRKPTPSTPGASAGTKPGHDDGARSFANHLISGLAGGALALLGAILVQNWQPTSNGGTNGGTGFVENITSQIASLSEKVKTIESAGSGGASQSDPASLAAIETRLSDLETTATELKTGLARIEGGTAASDTGAATDGSRADGKKVAALAKRINDFEAKLDSKLASLRKSIKQELKPKPAKGVGTSAAADFATLKKGLILDQKKSDQKIAAAQAAAQAAAEKLQQELKSVSESTAGLLAQFESFKSELAQKSQTFAKSDSVKTDMDEISAGLAALAARMDAIGNRENEQRDNARRVLLSLELANLKRAIDRGDAFEREFIEIKKLAGDDVDLSALEDYKSSKSLTVDALQTSFRPLARKILATTSSKEGGGVIDRILSNAKSIVRVRRIGDIEGDTAEAILARMETRLKTGDLDGVLSEAKSLKPPADDLIKDWLKQVDARHTIGRSLALLEKHFKSSLTASATQPGANTQSTNDEEDAQ